MYNNGSHLMISGCFISVLCIKMKQENSRIKPGGRDERAGSKTQNMFHLWWGISNSRFRREMKSRLCGRGGGCAEGNGVDFHLLSVFMKCFGLAAVLYGKVEAEGQRERGKKKKPRRCGETIAACCGRVTRTAPETW